MMQRAAVSIGHRRTSVEIGTARLTPSLARTDCGSGGHDGEQPDHCPGNERE